MSSSSRRPADPAAQLAHALSLPREQGGPLGEWTRLLQRVQTQTQALRRLRRSLAEVRDAAADLLEISPEDEDPRLTEARRAMVEQGMRAQESQMRLARVREICSRWGWTEDQIASLLALPGEPRTHVFPAAGPRATQELHDEKEVARLRDELAVERRRYAFAAAHWGAADIDALRAERDAARAMLTPRVYKEGDRPRLPEMVLYRSEGVWAPLHCDCLRPGDLWIPMPPPPDEGQR